MESSDQARQDAAKKVADSAVTLAEKLFPLAVNRQLKRDTPSP
jgi:hypothetical protein